MPTALILGATGLVGKSLLPLLLEAEEFTTVKAILRRPTGIDHPKLEEVLINFDQPEQWQALVEGNVLFSTFGTTLAQAGSKEAQYKVDFTYQYQVAEAAASHGATDYVLVSTLGASEVRRRSILRRARAVVLQSPPRSSSSSSRVFGQSFRMSCERPRSASRRPAFWHSAQ